MLTPCSIWDMVVNAPPAPLVCIHFVLGIPRKNRGRKNSGTEGCTLIGHGIVLSTKWYLFDKNA